MKRYWLTSISVLIGGLFVVLPILGGLFGDSEDNDDTAVLVIPLLIVVES